MEKPFARFSKFPETPIQHQLPHPVVEQEAEAAPRQITTTMGKARAKEIAMMETQESSKGLQSIAEMQWMKIAAEWRTFVV